MSEEQFAREVDRPDDGYTIQFLVSQSVIERWSGRLDDWSEPVQLRFVETDGRYDLVARKCWPKEGA